MSIFPATCSLGHAPVTINSGTEFSSHYVAQHAGTPPMDVQAALITLPTPGAASGATTVVSSVLGKYGVTRAALGAIDETQVTRAFRLTPSEIIEALDQLKISLSINFDSTQWFIGFFILVLENAASDKLEGVGGCMLTDLDTTVQRKVKWSSIMKHLNQTFSAEGKAINPRMIMTSIEDLLEEFWNDSTIAPLADLKARGTKRSRSMSTREWTCPAWAAVPGLFNHLQDETIINARRIFNAKANLEGSSSGANYTGLDEDGLAEEEALEQLKRHHLAQKLKYNIKESKNKARTAKSATP